jgi:ParB family chromosome partitioning protein
MVHKALGRGLDALLSSSRERKPKDLRTVTDVAPTPHTGQEIRNIQLHRIKPNRHQPRHHFEEDALKELSDSILKHGIAQPLVITETAVQGEFELVMGERRLRAAKIAGLQTVPCVVKKLSNRERFELALIENLQREDLNAMDKALALDNLMKEYSLTQDEVAKTLGVSRPAVANTLRFLRLHEKVQEALKSSQISEGHAKILAGLPHHSEQLRFLGKILTEKLSVRALEALITDQGTERKKPLIKKKKETPSEIKAYEEDLQRILGRRVEVQSTGNKGWIRFAFYSPWDLDNLCKRLGLAKDEEAKTE